MSDRKHLRATARANGWTVRALRRTDTYSDRDDRVTVTYTADGTAASARFTTTGATPMDAGHDPARFARYILAHPLPR